jgi:phosphatidylglycerophosphate synthase
MWSEVAAIYRSSKKKQDINWWTEWVCRPPAAVVVYALQGTRITPNQVTFASALVAVVSAFLLVTLPGWWGAIVAALVYELSFVLDCADGQLARLRKIASPLGHQLDFLMDEIKATLVLAAVTVRLWRDAPDPAHGERYLLVGLAGLVCLAAGLSLTTFMRRPEYGASSPTEDGLPRAVTRRRGLVGGMVGAVERAARVVVHYPAYLLIVALIPPGRLDLYFWAYSGVNALYAARAFLQIFFKLGRFS